MNRSLIPGAPRHSRRFAGPVVVLVSFVLILAITIFVVVRIVQTSGPAPAPEDIPERPGRTASP